MILKVLCKILIVAGVFLTVFSSSSCQKNLAEPPVIGLRVYVDGAETDITEDVFRGEIGARVDYVFEITAHARIAQVRTLTSMILSDDVKTVDETLTMGFTDKLKDEVRGTMYVKNIAYQHSIVVTDVDGNESIRSISVFPL